MVNKKIEKDFVSENATCIIKISKADGLLNIKIERGDWEGLSLLGAIDVLRNSILTDLQKNSNE